MYKFRKSNSDIFNFIQQDPERDIIYYMGPNGRECIACKATEDPKFSMYRGFKHSCEQDKLFYETNEDHEEMVY